ncbi:MAG: energy transducer TonB [Bacteroidales bacterium]
MEWTKEKTYALIGTIIFHAILVLLLFILAFRTPLPLPGEEGVEVNLGYSNQGMGRKPQAKPSNTAPVKPKTASKPKAEPKSSEKLKEKLITEKNSEAPALPSENKKSKAKTENKEITKSVDSTKVVNDNLDKKIAESKEEEVVEEKPVVNQRALYKGPSTKSDDGGGNEGVTGKPGNQGKSNGILDAQKYEGAGGLGNGVSFSLGGRGAKNIPKPTYNSSEQGRVVVTIYVDQQGNVIRCQAGAKGTNVSDPNLRKMAEDAAKKAKFTVDPTAPTTQKGTITYNFIRKN